jgi:type III secretion protein L
MSQEEPSRLLRDLPPGPGARILRGASADAWRDGYRFLTEASQIADQIKQMAREAYAAERARGYTDGRTEGAKEATRLVTDTANKVDRYLATLDLEIARLVMDVVRRVLGEFDAADLVSRAATRAIAEFRREKSLKVSVHPDALDRVRTALSSMITDGPGAALTIEADPQLGETGCVVSSEFAIVDASVETQLAAIAGALGIPSNPRNVGP